MVAEAALDPVISAVSSVPRTFTEEAGRDYIERQQRALQEGFGFSFVIAHDHDDVGVGSIGLWLRDVDLGRASVGYWVVPSARGHGVAARALERVSRWALGELVIPRLELAVEPWNQASTRTAERAGYTLEGLVRSWQLVDGERRDMYLYSMLASDLEL
jgi:RimJ/RimL family protein N-acetyltransferase